jgi:hypothetical protein
VGRHTVEERGRAPGGALQPWTPARPPWAVRHKILTGLGSVAASIVIAGVASAAVGGSNTGTRPPRHAGAVWAGSGSPAGLGAPVGIGSVVVARAPSPRLSAPKPPASPKAPAVSPPVGSPSTQPLTQQPTTSVSSLAALPSNTALTGSAAAAWADAAIAALGAPATSANVQTMADWFANEGTPHDLNNPLNLQTPYGGSTVSTASDSPASDGIQAYPSPADFVAAFPIEMNKGSYPAIVAALKDGTGMEGSAATPEIASELSVYSGGGYNSIPAA